MRKISFLYVLIDGQYFAPKNRKNPDKIRVFLWLYLFCSPLMVEMTGFEPAASSSRTKRATKLRYISIFNFHYSLFTAKALAFALYLMYRYLSRKKGSRAVVKKRLMITCPQHSRWVFSSLLCASNVPTNRGGLHTHSKSRIPFYTLVGLYSHSIREQRRNKFLNGENCFPSARNFYHTLLAIRDEISDDFGWLKASKGFVPLFV